MAKRSDGHPGTERSSLIIESAERLNMSVNGNPRFRVYLVPANGEDEGFSAITQSDAACNHGLENHLKTWSHPATVLTVRFSRAGRITHLIPEGKPE